MGSYTAPPCAGLILIFLMSLPRKKSGILSSLFQTLNIRLSFPSCTPPASGSGKSVPCVTKISAVLPCVYISAIPKRVLTGMPSFHKKALDILTQYWFRAGKPRGFLFPNRNDPQRPMAAYTVNQFIFAKETELGMEHRFTCILSGMPLAHIFMRTVRIFSRSRHCSDINP